MEYEEKDIGNISIELVKKLIDQKNKIDEKSATLLFLSGDLGAGKTRLTKEILSSFGVDGPVISPTFVVMKKYELKNSPWNSLIHIDAYRMKDENTEILGLQEIFVDPKNLVVIEWPEYLKNIPDFKHVKVYIEHISETKRKILF